jgi:hypothetical protein
MMLPCWSFFGSCQMYQSALGLSLLFALPSVPPLRPVDSLFASWSDELLTANRTGQFNTRRSEVLSLAMRFDNACNNRALLIPIECAACEISLAFARLKLRFRCAWWRMLALRSEGIALQLPTRLPVSSLSLS